MLSTVWNTQRGSQSSIEKRRWRKEIEVTRRRGGGVKKIETNLACDQFPKCSPQPGTPKEIHKVEKRRGREERDRGDQEEKRRSQKERDRSSQ